MRVKYLILFALLTSYCFGYSQKSNVQVVGDKTVSDLVKKNIEFNEKAKTVPGYRIQIVSLSGENSKSRAFSMKEKFLKEYPEMTAYLIFDEPNFKVKVGDFVSKLDAFLFMQQLKGSYPCSIVKDNVYPIRWELEELVPEDENEDQ